MGNTIRSVLAVAALWAGAAGFPPASAQTESETEREQRRLIEAHQHEFDYLLGDWTFTGTRRFSDSPVPIRGHWSFNRSADGPIVIDEFRTVDDSGRTIYVSTTVRAYSAVEKRWNLVGVEPGAGVVHLGVAWKEGDDMRIDQKFGTNLWRIRYYDIRSDRFSWTAAISPDDGKTWIENVMTMEARRTGPARPPMAWTPRG